MYKLTLEFKTKEELLAYLGQEEAPAGKRGKTKSKRNIYPKVEVKAPKVEAPKVEDTPKVEVPVEEPKVEVSPDKGTPDHDKATSMLYGLIRDIQTEAGTDRAKALAVQVKEGLGVGTKPVAELPTATITKVYDQIKHLYETDNGNTDVANIV